jgi:trans-aconitate 2-methyltransferase
LFDGFAAPFVHVEADAYGELAASAGLSLTNLTVTDHDWDYGSRSGFRQWCAVGTTAWTDRLPVEDRGLFVDALVDAYEPVAGGTALFRFTQMRAELRR